MAGFWSKLFGIDSYDAAQRVLAPEFEPYMATGGIPVMDPGSPLELWRRAQVDQLWRTQPNVRKVVDFIARNVASIPLHVYERVSDVERRRVTGHPLTDLLGEPRPRVGPYRFWHGLLTDALLYEKWCVIKFNGTGGRRLVHVPSWRLAFKTNELREVEAIKYWVGEHHLIDTSKTDGWVDIPLEYAIFDLGYSPAGGGGVSPLETLAPVLRETREAIEYRNKMWTNGARVPAYVARPLEAPEWDNAGRNRFAAGLRAYRQGGSAEGGWPLLEDGMEIRELGMFNSSDMLDLEGRELSAVEVATAWHVPPELLGIRPANYGAMRELRSTLYRDVLGPYIDAWVQPLNILLTPDLAGSRKLYIEPHLDAKLRGSFEEQALIAQATVGRPVMTLNEYRARNNLPPVEGGDEIVTPMNVTHGGQASPVDSGSQNRVPDPVRDDPKAAPESTRRAKDAPTETEQEKRLKLLRRFFARQGAAVLAALQEGDDWWDAERWDSELADVLLSIHLLTATTAGRRELENLGLDPDEYDEPRTMAFLREASKRSAESMNSYTHDAVEAAVADEDADPSSVFEDEGRLVAAATTATTFAAGFGTVEAARQQAPGATKTWVVNSSNPRPSHASMDGETVGIDENFSNGLPWPGAAGSDADEVAGCQCSVIINIP